MKAALPLLMVCASSLACTAKPRSLRVPILIALLGMASPLLAQTPESSPADRRLFIEGAVLAEYLDAPPAINSYGAGGEFALAVWQGKPQKNDRSTTHSVRLRIESLTGDWLVSLLYAPNVSITRRIALETPLGFAIGASSGEIGAGFTFNVGLPILLTKRAALVPRGGGYLLSGSDGIGMLATLGLGLRWQF